MVYVKCAADERRPLLPVVDLTTATGTQRCKPPRVGEVDKAREVLRMAITRLRVLLCQSTHHSSMSASFEPLSDKGRFVKTYVEPMFHWWGANFRLLNSPCLGTVDVTNAAGQTITAVNGASHNYAGFYQPTPASEELQRLCLDTLPVSDAAAVPLLRDAVHAAMARFLPPGTDFCVTTSTGYGANYVALPALICGSSSSSQTVVVMDKACHNSIYTGAFLGKCAEVRKFAHNDVRELERILASLVGVSAADVIVVVEGLYSMDGDVPPLAELWRLKTQYGFVLYCDEAHSFLSIGSSGLGCVQYWNETQPPHKTVPWDLVDVRTGTLSKAIGGIGGFIAGKAFLRDRIMHHIQTIAEPSHLSIPTSTMVQTLLVLGQPARIVQHLHRLSTIAHFCRAELARFGVYIYGDEAGTPILPVWAGRPSTSARLSYAFRKEGLLASPVTTPAVPFWESRVRVNLSADYSDADVDRLVDAIIAGSVAVGLVSRKKTRRVVRRRFKSQPLRLLAEHHQLDDNDAATTATTTLTTQIRDLIRQSALALPSHNNNNNNNNIQLTTTAITAGHKARQLYGVGAGSARWISGTFPPHLAVEALLARILGTEAAMTYADATIGLASTIAALARPFGGGKQNKHVMLYPRRTTMGAVRDGVTLMPPRERRSGALVGYESADTVAAQMRRLGGRGVCFTVYVEEEDVDVVEGLVSAAGGCPLTILVHSPSRLLDQREILLPDTRGSADKVQLLVYGSFDKTLGLPGGYLAGSEALIRELRYTSRGYMYTTSTAPFVMEMVQVALGEAVERL